jgi:AAA domain/DnaB-like helicase N terminal domain
VNAGANTLRRAGLRTLNAADMPPDNPVAHLRTPPQSIEAEQSVLGSLLLDGSSFGQVADVLVAADFYRFEHRLIFGAIEAIVRRGEPVDPLTVFEQLQSESQDCGGLPYLNQLSMSVPSAANVRRYAEVVAERATMRSIIAFTDSVASQAFSLRSGAAGLLDEAKAELTRIETARHVQSRRIPLLTPAQLQESAQAVRWLVKHVMPAESIGMLYGASGTFKSFIALDAALHVAHGLPWLGRKTAQGPVIYIAAEGGSGLWSRVLAWHRTRGLRWAEAPFFVVPVGIDLKADAWRVVEAAQALGISPSLVVVDTLSQTYAGEENSANEMAAYLREIGLRFRSLWSCAVALVHHTGHNATERPRGSSAIRANLDFLLGVFRDEKEMLATLTCEKQKDGDLFDDATFSLAVHTLGTDEDGDKVTSLVARHLSSAEEVEEAASTEAASGRSGRGRRLLSLVQNGMEERGLRKLFNDECIADGLSAETAKRSYFRARAHAIKAGYIDIAQGIVITLSRKP